MGCEARDICTDSDADQAVACRDLDSSAGAIIIRRRECLAIYMGEWESC